MPTGQKILLLDPMLLPVLDVAANDFLQKINHHIYFIGEEQYLLINPAFSTWIFFLKYQDEKYNRTIQSKRNPDKKYQ
jgi:hypothetical protein